MEQNNEITIKIIEAAYKSFLKTFNLRENEVVVDFDLLNETINRYWKDVHRLKCFHKIDYIDCHKIAAYLTYWICKLQPFNVSKTAYRTKAAYLSNALITLSLGIRLINNDRKNKNLDGIALEGPFIEAFLYTDCIYQSYVGLLYSGSYMVLYQCI